MARVTGPSRSELDARGDAFAAHVFRAVRATLHSVALETRNVDDLTRIQSVWTNTVEHTLMPRLRVSWNVAVQGVRVQLEEINASRQEALVAAVFEIPKVSNPLAESFLADAKNRLVAIGDVVWYTARGEMLTGLELGEGVAELRERVVASASVSRKRAEVIARTEVNSAMNNGAYQQMKALDVATVKEWIATNDSRTRESHEEVDGEEIDGDAKFTVGGYPMSHPHDPEGPPSETINCRCTLAWEIADDEDDYEDDLVADGSFHLPSKHNQKTHGRRYKTPGDKSSGLRDVKTPGKKSAKSQEISPKGQRVLDFIKDEIKQPLPASEANGHWYSAFDNPNFSPATTDKYENAIASEKAPDAMHAGYIPEDMAKAWLPLKKVDPASLVQTQKWLRQIDLSQSVSSDEGDRDPIIVYRAKDGTRYLTNGHHRINLALAKGLDEIEVREATATIDVPSVVSPRRKETPRNETLTAAGGFEEHEHPRDGKGRFAKKAGGALSAGKKLKITHGLIHSKHEPGKVIAVNGSANKRVVWDGNKYLLQEKDANGGWPTVDTAIKSKAYARVNEFDSEWHEPTSDDSDDGEAKVDVIELSAPATDTPKPTSGGGKKKSAGKPGDPLKITHGLVHQKHEPGEIIAVNGKGNKRVVWDGDKYRLQIKPPLGNLWHTKKTAIKSKAYIKINEYDSDWRVPSPVNDNLAKKPTPPLPDVDEYDDDEDNASNWFDKEDNEEPYTDKDYENEFPADGDEDEADSFFDDPTKVDNALNALKPGTPESIAKYKKVGGQKGSQSGALTQAPDGQRWYVKSLKSESHARNEVLANRLYAAAGVKVPQVELAQLDGGPLAGKTGIGVKSKIIDGASNFASKIGDPAYRKKVHEDFAVDAWLGNWDVVGLNNDNIITASDGNPARIDNGGALLYRAQGTSKGMAFGDKVTELKTLRDPSVNPQAAKAFKDVTDDDIRAGVAKIEAITPEQIDALVDSAGFNAKSAANLKKTLKARRQDLLDQYGSDAKPGTAATPAPPPPMPPAVLPNGPTTPSKYSHVGNMNNLVNGLPYQKGKLFADESGETYYVKPAHSVHHANNEFLAANLYTFANVATEKTELVELDPAKMDGKTGVGVKTMPVSGVKSIIEAMKIDPNVKKQVNEGFAVDAWLGNWDAVGMGYDNLTVDKDGKVRRTNLKGSLLYRANGTSKGGKFGDTVTELDSLRNPSVNPASAKIFADVTDEDIRAGVAHIEAMTPKMIDFIVSQSGFTGPSFDDLTSKLKARRLDLIKKYGSEAPPAASSGVATPALSSQPTATNALNTGGVKTYTASQKAKVYAVFNKHNLKWFNKTDAIYDAALEVSKTHSDLTMGDALDIMDQSLKKKTGNPFRTKVEKFLKTQTGKNHAAAKGGSSSIGSTSSTIPPGSAPSTSNLGTTVPEYGQYKKMNRAAASAMQKKMDELFPPPWTKEQRDALRTYTGGSYTTINKCARNVTPCAPQTLELIKNIKAGMKPSTDDIMIFRKTNPKAFGLQNASDMKALIGKVIKDDGVISTSIRSNMWQGQLHLEIEAPKGSMLAWVQPISLHPGEDEIVVAPGTHYEVVSATPFMYGNTTSSAIYVVRLRIVPGSDAHSDDLKKAQAIV